VGRAGRLLKIACLVCCSWFVLEGHILRHTQATLGLVAMAAGRWNDEHLFFNLALDPAFRSLFGF